jgi:Holliday junction DNA helicase RuvA
MIDTLHGKLVNKKPTYILIEVNGVGYGVNIPVSTYQQLPDIGEIVKIFTYLDVREDALSLYGFYTYNEKEMFLSLISVSGIGAKIALALLSTLSVEELQHAIVNEDIKKLTLTPGIGKKGAQRVVLELKEKIPLLKIDKTEVTQVTPSDIAEDVYHNAITALVSLGYKKKEAQLAVRKAEEITKEDRSIEGLIKSALKFLAQ